MLNVKAFANALTAVIAVFYVLCAALSFIAPDLIFGIGQAWMHTINASAVKATYTPDLGTFIYGLITISAITWVTTYGTIALYNKWAK